MSDDETIKLERVLLALHGAPTKDERWVPTVGEIVWWMQYSREQPPGARWTNIDWYLVRVLRLEDALPPFAEGATVEFLDPSDKPGYEQGTLASVSRHTLWPVGTLTKKVIP